MNKNHQIDNTGISNNTITKSKTEIIKTNLRITITLLLNKIQEIKEITTLPYSIPTKKN